MKSQQLNPKVIHLKELPLEGRSYQYSRESGELTPVLTDLIGTAPYHLDFHLQPVGNAYRIKGKVSTSLELLCCRCAIEFQHRVDESFDELLVVEEGRPRGSHSAKPNHTSEFDSGAPYCNYLLSERFNVGEYAHEIIALSEPIRPMGKGGQCDESCENYQKAIEKGWLSPENDEDNGEKEEKSPFAALKGLKV